LIVFLNLWVIGLGQIQFVKTGTVRDFPLLARHLSSIFHRPSPSGFLSCLQLLVHLLLKIIGPDDSAGAFRDALLVFIVANGADELICRFENRPYSPSENRPYSPSFRAANYSCSSEKTPQISFRPDFTAWDE
jgi:hypothetical protein